jgi:hypothetical protein
VLPKAKPLPLEPLLQWLVQREPRLRLHLLLLHLHLHLHLLRRLHPRLHPRLPLLLHLHLHLSLLLHQHRHQRQYLLLLRLVKRTNFFRQLFDDWLPSIKLISTH